MNIKQCLQLLQCKAVLMLGCTSLLLSLAAANCKEIPEQQQQTQEARGSKVSERKSQWWPHLQCPL